MRSSSLGVVSFDNVNRSITLNHVNASIWSSTLPYLACSISIVRSVNVSDQIAQKLSNNNNGSGLHVSDSPIYTERVDNLYDVKGTNEKNQVPIEPSTLCQVSFLSGNGFH
jgi:hypothetical protein